MAAFGRAGVLVALLALAVEVGLRVAGVVPCLGFSNVPMAIARPDPRLGWRLPASSTVTFGDAVARLDDDGLRNPAAAQSTPVSVLVLGDERTFGWGVGDDEAYPAVLAAWLHERCPGCGRVMNGGVPGYDSYRGLMLLRELGPRFAPAVVVAAFGLDDAWLDAATWARFDVPAVARVSVAAGALVAWTRRPGDGWWARVPRTPLPRYVRNLRSIVGETRRLGASLVLVDIGWGATLRDQAAEAGRRLRRGRFEDDYHAAARAVATLDAVPLVEVIGPQLDGGAMLDAVHPSAAGHRLIARAVGERIVAERLLLR